MKINFCPTCRTDLAGLRTPNFCPACGQTLERINGAKPRFVRTWERLPDAIGDEYQSGKTILEIATAHGTNVPAVWNKLNALGVKIRPSGRGIGNSGGNAKVKKENVPDVLQRYQAGETLQSIGNRYGVTRERIRQIVVKNNLTPRHEAIGRASISKAIEKKAEIQARKDERMKFIHDISKLWKEGALFPVLMVALNTKGTQQVAGKIAYYRARYGIKLFPYRDPSHWKIKHKEEHQEAA